MTWDHFRKKEGLNNPHPNNERSRPVKNLMNVQTNERKKERKTERKTERKNERKKERKKERRKKERKKGLLRSLNICEGHVTE